MKSIVVLAGYDNCKRGYHGVDTGTVGREDIGTARLALGFGADTGPPRRTDAVHTVDTNRYTW